MSFHPENPFTRGKSKLVANLMLDGRKNDEIREFWEKNGFETKLGGLHKELLHDVRATLRAKGLIDEYGNPIKKEGFTPFETHQTPQTSLAPSLTSGLDERGSSFSPNETHQTSAPSGLG